jgi:prepilin-type processing-associated H-X9-DG protein
VTSPKQHGMIIYLLPYLEQGNIWSMYDFKQSYNHANNKAASDNDIAVLICPSAPTRTGKFANDYHVCAAMEQSVYDILRAGNHITSRSKKISVIQHTNTTRAHIRDGLSNSMMIFEDAGRPFEFDKTGKQISVGPISGARWNDVQGYFHIHQLCNGTSPMNCTNSNEIYSFHSGGCNFTFGDGSVSFITESINPEVFMSLFTRDAGDVVSQRP